MKPSKQGRSNLWAAQTTQTCCIWRWRQQRWWRRRQAGWERGWRKSRERWECVRGGVRSCGEHTSPRACKEVVGPSHDISSLCLLSRGIQQRKEMTYEREGRGVGVGVWGADNRDKMMVFGSELELELGERRNGQWYVFFFFKNGRE
jgi:hypothetical protein